jgi:hypothetical protein
MWKILPWNSQTYIGANYFLSLLPLGFSPAHVYQLTMRTGKSEELKDVDLIDDLVRKNERLI